jgi:lysyl-tRNA synthetase class II
MEITEVLIEGMVKYLTGGGTTIFYHPDGNKGVEGARRVELDFRRPWKRYDMIGTLEEKLGVTFPPGQTLHTEKTNRWLRDLCVKVGRHLLTTSTRCSLQPTSTMLNAVNRALTPACSTRYLSSPSLVLKLVLTSSLPTARRRIHRAPLRLPLLHSWTPTSHVPTRQMAPLASWAV